MRLCCVILDKTFNQSTYHASKNSQHRTGDKLWGASCEVKPSVSWKWRCGCECDLSEQESIATAILWFSVNNIMFCIEAYVSITWCGELEQAVLLTELLFKSTNAGHAGQEKCSLKQWRSADEKRKKIKVQKEFYPNIHTLLLISGYFALYNRICKTFI